jgi:hypothetical protein
MGVIKNSDCAIIGQVDNIDNTPPLIIDELLTYVSFYRNKSNVDALRRTANRSFLLFTNKHLLIQKIFRREVFITAH